MGRIFFRYSVACGVAAFFLILSILLSCYYFFIVYRIQNPYSKRRSAFCSMMSLPISAAYLAEKVVCPPTAQLISAPGEKRLTVLL